MGKTMDIKNTKEVLDLAFTLGGVYKNAMTDGKLALDDLAYLMAVVPKFQPAVEDINMVIDELKDLSTAEAQELLAYAKAKSDENISNEDLANKVVKGLTAALAVGEFIAVL